MQGSRAELMWPLVWPLNGFALMVVSAFIGWVVGYLIGLAFRNTYDR